MTVTTLKRDFAPQSLINKLAVLKSDSWHFITE